MEATTLWTTCGRIRREPVGRGLRLGAMKLRTTQFALALLLVIACQGPATPGSTARPTVPPESASPNATPAGTATSGVAGIVRDLTNGGVIARIGDPFAGEPVGGEGVTLCIGAESLQTYTFIDHEAALSASAKIDPDDPSSVGNAHVEWAGRPRFWLRDNVILLYLGENAATDTGLRTLLGPPFAEGEAGRMPLPGPPCS
jgi:hypothetical protein